MSQVSGLSASSSGMTHSKKDEPTTKTSLIQRIVNFVKANPFKAAAIVAGAIAGAAGFSYILGFARTKATVPPVTSFAGIKATVPPVTSFAGIKATVPPVISDAFKNAFFASNSNKCATTYLSDPKSGLCPAAPVVPSLESCLKSDTMNNPDSKRILNELNRLENHFVPLSNELSIEDTLTEVQIIEGTKLYDDVYRLVSNPAFKNVSRQLEHEPICKETSQLAREYSLDFSNN